ncbi:DUF3053 family protein, partial [Bordetella pertussis]
MEFCLSRTCRRRLSQIASMATKCLLQGSFPDASPIMPAMRSGAAWVLEGRFMRFGWGLPALAVVLALAGCVNREPEERAAFIAYLEQVAAPQAGVVAAPPDPPTRKALGDYEAQYEPMEAA